MVTDEKIIADDISLKIRFFSSATLIDHDAHNPTEMMPH